MKGNQVPLVSIIVPVYNAEKYLNRCIDSILSQTMTDFELLLIDDGSKDNSGRICDEYAEIPEGDNVNEILGWIMLRENG